jgi:hypothetical protein
VTPVDTGAHPPREHNPHVQLQPDLPTAGSEPEVTVPAAAEEVAVVEVDVPAPAGDVEAQPGLAEEFPA